MRERLLLSAKFHSDAIEQMRFITMIKAVLLDRSNTQQVADFNQAMTALQDLTSGKKKELKTPKDVNNIMKDFQENYLKPLKSKVKNFERAK